MKRKQRIRGRGIALALGLCLMLQSMPAVSASGFGEIPGLKQEAEDVDVVVTELEELPEPDTTKPQKGYIELTIIKGSHITDAGETIYDTEEVYLPVLVDKEKNVYGKLDKLVELLDLRMHTAGSNVKVDVGDHVSVYFTLNSPLAAYEYVDIKYSVRVHMDQMTVFYESNWYVPLDPFLVLCSGGRAYTGLRTELDTEKLQVARPRETILDVAQTFYQKSYNLFAFDFTKDLQYTQEAEDQMEFGATWVQNWNGLLSLDSAAWKNLLTGRYFSAMGVDKKNGSALSAEEKEKIQRTREGNADQFMTCLMQFDDAQTDAMVEHAKNRWDIVSCLIGAYEEAAGGDFDTLLDQAVDVVKKTKYAPALLAKNGVKRWAGEWKEWMGTVAEGVDPYSVGATLTDETANILGYVLSYVSIIDSLQGQDQWMVNATKTFWSEQSKLKDAELGATLQKTGRNLTDRFPDASFSSVNSLWWRENWMGFVSDKAALAAGGPVATLKLISDVWKITSKVIYGKGLKETDSYLNAIYAELDSLTAEAASDLLDRVTIWPGCRLDISLNYLDDIPGVLAVEHDNTTCLTEESMK